jgi:hypothetical protein
MQRRSDILINLVIVALLSQAACWSLHLYFRNGWFGRGWGDTHGFSQPVLYLLTVGWIIGVGPGQFFGLILATGALLVRRLRLRLLRWAVILHAVIALIAAGMGVAQRFIFDLVAGAPMILLYSALFRMALPVALLVVTIVAGLWSHAGTLPREDAWTRRSRTIAFGAVLGMLVFRLLSWSREFLQLPGMIGAFPGILQKWDQIPFFDAWDFIAKCIQVSYTIFLVIPLLMLRRPPRAFATSLSLLLLGTLALAIAEGIWVSIGVDHDFWRLTKAMLLRWETTPVVFVLAWYFYPVLKARWTGDWRAAPFCPRCDYDLRGSPEPRCSECGMRLVRGG